MNRVADFCEDDLKVAVKNITTMIEPIMIIFMGLLVGGIAMALLLRSSASRRSWRTEDGWSSTCPGKGGEGGSRTGPGVAFSCALAGDRRQLRT